MSVNWGQVCIENSSVEIRKYCGHSRLSKNRLEDMLLSLPLCSLAHHTLLNATALQCREFKAKPSEQVRLTNPDIPGQLLPSTHVYSHTGRL